MKKKRLYSYILYIIGVILLIQGSYFMYLFLVKPVEAKGSLFSEPISIIICAHNEAENLRVFLPKFLDQNYQLFEVILVDDRSTDTSKEIINQLLRSFKNLKLISIEKTPEEWNSKKWALQKGVEASSYNYLLFSDADCYPISNNWIQIMANGFTQSNLLVGFGAYENNNTFLNKFIQYETYQTAISMFGMAQKGINYMSTGRNYGCAKDLYLSFDWSNLKNVLGGDDDLFSNRQTDRQEIILDSDSHTISKAKTTWKTYIYQKIRHIHVSKNYSLLNKSIIGIYNLSSLLYWMSFIYLFTNPFLALTSLIFRTSILFYNFVYASRCKIIGLKFFEVIYIDLCYTLFLWIFGPIALVAKKIQWK